MIGQQIDRTVEAKSQPKKETFLSFAFVIHSSKKRLDLDGGFNSLALLLLAIIGLGTHDTTTPVTALVLVLVGVSLLDSGDELGELRVVLRANLGQSNNSSGLTAS